MSRRAVGLWTCVCVVALMAACSMDSVMEPQVEAQFAKGGNGKGKGGNGDETSRYALLEYFVFSDGYGGNLVHVVGEGDVPEVNLNVVHDSPFNGVRDNGVHYEYTTFAPLPAPVLETFPDGTFHIDVPWNGLRNDPSAASQADGEVQEWFSDFLVTDVGDGADPFAFQVRFQRNQTNLLWVTPHGIVMDGVDPGETEIEITDDRHGLQTVRSYATYRGESAPEQVFLTEVSFTNVQCKVVTIREGRGKNATTRELARVTGDYRIRAYSTADVPPSVWVEFHMVDMTDPDQPVYFEGTSRTADSLYDVIEGVLQRDLDVIPVEPMTIQLAVDYVFPTGDSWSWAYDPAQNTNVGFSTDANPARSLGDASPTAFSLESTFTCK